MNFDGTTVRDCDSITGGLYNYFRQLYTPSDVDGNHDDVCERHVNDNLDVLMNDITPDSRACVLPSETEDIISKCPKGKADGHYELQYERFIHTKQVISPVVANILTWMLTTYHVT